MKTLEKKTEPNIIEFKTPDKWRKWLEKNHAKVTQGIWLKYYKKDSGKKTISYAEALDEALCYGWIDGQSKSLDSESYLQKFTPRRKRSMWSLRNTEHVARLIKSKKMTKAGLAEVERAKLVGRWRAAYSSPSKIVMHKDLKAALAKSPKAKSFYQTLNKSNKYYIYFHLQSAKKDETRARRLKKIVQMLKAGVKFY